MLHTDEEVINSIYTFLLLFSLTMTVSEMITFVFESFSSAPNTYIGIYFNQ